MQPNAPLGAPLTPAIVFESLQAHQRTAALRAAIELDVFRAVGQGPGDGAFVFCVTFWSSMASSRSKMAATSTRLPAQRSLILPRPHAWLRWPAF